MSDDKLIGVFLNPLLLIEADEEWATVRKEEITPQSILEFICTRSTGADVESPGIKAKMRTTCNKSVHPDADNLGLILAKVFSRAGDATHWAVVGVL